MTQHAYNCYAEKTSLEKENNHKIEAVFKSLGWKYKENKDDDLQKMGIDFFIKCPENKTMDVKFQTKKYNHETEMLLELENRWNNSGKLYKIGWVYDKELVTDYLLDYCLETNEWFMYDYKAIREWASTHIDHYAPECYTRLVMNKWMSTKIMMVPRKYLNNFLVLKGKAQNVQ
jgi:hypothetical protein